MARTGLQMAADVIREARGQADMQEARQALQDAFNKIDGLANWEFMKKEVLMNFRAVYSTGHVAVSAGGTAVTGSGTVWDPTWTYQEIKFASRRLAYPVTVIGGATSLTLASALSGTAAITSDTYRLYQPRFALPTDCEPARDMRIKGPQGWGRYGDGDLSKLEQGRVANRRIDEIGAPNNPVFWTDDEFDDAAHVGTIRLWPFPTVAGEMRLTYYRKLPAPTSSSVTVLPEAFERLPILIAASQLMRLRKQMGWQERDAEATMMLKALYARHAASPAYENRPEPDTGEQDLPMQFGFGGRLYTRG
jgi:hypothetical protein